MNPMVGAFDQYQYSALHIVLAACKGRKYSTVRKPSKANSVNTAAIYVCVLRASVGTCQVCGAGYMCILFMAFKTIPQFFSFTKILGNSRKITGDFFTICKQYTQLTFN